MCGCVIAKGHVAQSGVIVFVLVLGIGGGGVGAASPFLSSLVVVDAQL